jgi:hypothetical protein
MSAYNGDVSYDTFVCALRLLFDGKAPRFIASAIVEAMNDEDGRVRLFWDMADVLPIEVVAAVRSDTIEDWLSDCGLKFTGDAADMRHLMRMASEFSHTEYMYEDSAKIVVGEAKKMGVVVDIPIASSAPPV